MKLNKMNKITSKVSQLVLSAFGLALLLAPAVAGAQGWIDGKQRANSGGLPQGTVLGVVGALMQWLLAAFGFLAIIAFVISGIQYLTAAGDEGQIDTAKNHMKFSIIGVIVALSGWIIINAIDSWLNGSTFF